MEPLWETNPEGFKAMILSKHPEGVASDGKRYADIPAEELTRRIIAKFPNGVTNDGRKYSDFLQKVKAPKPDALTRAGNVAEKVTGALGLGGVVDTLGTNLANIGNVLNPKTSLDQKVAISRALPQTSLKQNIGTGLQLGALAAPVARVPATVVGAAKLGGIIGGTAAGGGSLAQNDTLSTVAKKTAVGGTAGAAFGAGMALGGKFLERVGDKIQYSIIKPTKVDIEDGFNIETIKKNNLGGSLTTVFRKTESKLDELTSQLNKKLSASDKKINLIQVFENTAKKLQGGKMSGFGSNTSSSKALAQLKAEIAAVGKDVSVTEAQVIKRASGHFGAWQYGMFDPDSTARQKVYNVFYTQLKEAIEKGSPAGVKDINKQMSELIPVLNAVIRRIPVAERNNALSLTDVIGLVGSAIEPRALGITLVNLLSKSGGVANILSKLGPKVGQAGPIGAFVAGGAANQLSNTRQ